MSQVQLTPAQQGALWPLLAEAWRVHARANDLRENDSKAKEAWRHELLVQSCGVYSLKEIPRGGPLFARFMAALQVIARNDVNWIIAANRSDAATLHHLVVRLITDKAIDHHAALAVARRALKLETPLHDFSTLKPAQLMVLLRLFHKEGDRINHWSQSRDANNAAAAAA
jgi:hypothetical protein